MPQSYHEIELRCEVALAFQTALLGMVTPNLRGVCVEWNAHQIKGKCFYEGEILDFEHEIVSDIEGEVISHFPNHKIELKAEGFTNSISLDQLSSGVWVYRRHEHTPA